MATIHINFMGVAVHLVGVIPGVPCRVVMPDATASYLYEGEALDRHFSSLQWIDPTKPEPQIEEYSRHHVMVGDPVMDQDFQLDQSMKDLYQLTSWVPNLQLSSEVIYAGRAAIYFDIFYGKLAMYQMNPPNGALYTQLTIDVEDDAPPALITIPFHYASVDFEPMPPLPKPWFFPAGVDTVSFVNMGVGCHESKNDFALNFLVTRGGIPRDLKDLPGQPIVPPPGNGRVSPNEKAIPLKVMDALSQACSASWFP